MNVYFIQVGADGPIKIGLAGDPARRLSSLQAGHHEELRLLASRPGARELEMDLHARYAEGRIRGEWFRPETPGLADEIERARQAPRDRYVTRRETYDRVERIEARAVALVRQGRWDEAERLAQSIPPEDRYVRP